MSSPAIAPTVLLFGAPELLADGVTPFVPERRFQLLAMLALRSGQWAPREQLATLFWPERSSSEARRNLRKVVFKAHAVPGAQTLEASEHALRWNVATDLQAFAHAVQAQRFGDAVALRRGPLLAGLDDADGGAWSDWLAAERSSWQQAWHRAALGDLQQRADPAQRIAAAQAMLRVDPLDEAALAALIEAHLALGQPASARGCYDAYAARLADELGVEPARELRALCDRIGAAGAAPGAAARPMPAPASGADGEVFVGRRTELAELAVLLANPEVRMTTILGPGGIGKSSLARRAQAASAALFPGGSWWLELQDLSDSRMVIARLAQQLGTEVGEAFDAVPLLARRMSRPAVPKANTGALQREGDPVSRGRSLLVLDNAEHLPELPALIDRLLAACAPLSVLLTSRARSYSAHECLLPLSGLALPDEDSRDLEAASAFDAVRLFEQRARSAQRGFALGRHLRAVIEICDAVAGMPLAIQLAASWVRLLPPEEIARELADAGGLLERDPAMRGAAARPQHHSMQAVLDHSWNLLSPPERRALAALAVFQGGFTRAAAQRVAAVPMPLLSSLVDKSLLAVDDGGRFGMHPLIAGYALQQLEDDAARVADVRSRHAEHFALHLAALAPHAIGDQRLLVAGVQAEFANCRAAWQHAVETQRADLVYAMVRAWWSFFENRGRLREGIELLSPALALPKHSPAAARALARLRQGLSLLHHRNGESRKGLELARSGVAAAEHCGDTEAYVGCVLNSGMCLWYDGHVEEARGWFERGLAIARERADRHCTAWALGNLGVCLNLLGESEAAERCLLQALAGSRELGDQYNVGVHLNNLGTLRGDLEDWPGARRYYEDGLRHCTGYGIRSMATRLRLKLAQLHYRCAEPAAARVHFEAVLDASRDSGQRIVEWSAELGLARIEVDAGRLDAALPRVQRVAGAARLSSAWNDVLAATALYGDLRAARGDAVAAAQIWRMALAQEIVLAPLRRLIERQLAALPGGHAAAAQAPALTLEDVLQQLEAESTAAAH